MTKTYTFGIDGKEVKVVVREAKAVVISGRSELYDQHHTHGGHITEGGTGEVEPANKINLKYEIIKWVESNNVMKFNMIKTTIYLFILFNQCFQLSTLYWALVVC